MNHLILYLPLLLVQTSDHQPDVVKTVTQSVSVESQAYEPVSFKFSKELKPGWSVEDKIQYLNANLTVSSKLKYVQSGDTVYCWAPPGNHEFKYFAFAINWTKQDLDQREFIATIKILGDLNPDPDPDPDPPFPDPFPGIGLQVLIIEEQSLRHTLSREQRAIFQSLEVRNFLDEKCRKNSAGQPKWIVLDQDTVFTEENEWKRAMQLPRTSPFWAVISNGKKWESSPLPGNPSEFLSKLRGYVQ